MQFAHRREAGGERRDRRDSGAGTASDHGMSLVHVISTVYVSCLSILSESKELMDVEYVCHSSDTHSSLRV